MDQHSGHRSDSLKPARALLYIEYRYIIKSMIKSFREKDTPALFEGRCLCRCEAILRVAERKWVQLDAEATLDFLCGPPGNRARAQHS